ncbi:MAG: alpha/beta hydrolase [Candidatus Limnocylindrales bacterium]
MGYDQRLELADGRLVWYLDEGPDHGLPVVFCHGSPSSRLAAVDLVGGTVERGGRLIAPDRPGMGRSDPEPGRSLAGWAGDVAELMNALGVARFRVLAVSAGGPYALALAWALPDRVERVALLSSPGSFDIPGALDGMRREHRFTWLMARWSPRVLGWLLGRQIAVLRQDPAAFERAIVDSMHGADREALEALGPEGRRRFITAPMVEALANGTKGAVEDLRTLRAPWGFGVQSIELPVHLWHGEADDATPKQMGGWLAAMIPGAEAHFLPGEGHVSTILRYADEALDVLLAE